MVVGDYECYISLCGCTWLTPFCYIRMPSNYIPVYAFQFCYAQWPLQGARVGASGWPEVLAWRSGDRSLPAGSGGSSPEGNLAT